jgi:hypothetical protein
MKQSPIFAAALLSLCFFSLRASAESPDATSPAQVETLVCIRHGEKPANDQGQLTFQGLNRSLALPDVLIKKYGRAGFVFAPGTQHPISHDGVPYCYIRPLITIEPTAIRLALPVDARFAFDEIEPLQKELLSPAYQNSLVFIAWEHIKLEQFAKDMLDALGADSSVVPHWPGKDYDSIYVLRIRTENGRRTATFAHDQEGLDGMSLQPPDPKK